MNRDKLLSSDLLRFSLISSHAHPTFKLLYKPDWNCCRCWLIFTGTEEYSIWSMCMSQCYWLWSQISSYEQLLEADIMTIIYIVSVRKKYLPPLVLRTRCWKCWLVRIIKLLVQNITWIQCKHKWIPIKEFHLLFFLLE